MTDYKYFTNKKKLINLQKLYCRFYFFNFKVKKII